MHLMYCVFQVSKPNCWHRFSYSTNLPRSAGSRSVGTGGDARAEIAPLDFGRKINARSRSVGAGVDARAEIAPLDFGRKRNAGSRSVGAGVDARAEIAPLDFGRKRNADSRADETGGTGDEIAPSDFVRKRNADSRADGTGGTGGEIAPPFGRKRSKSCSIRIFTCPLKLVFYELSHFCPFAVGFSVRSRNIFSSTFEIVY